LIPGFIDNGNLPAGIHWATWQQIEERFGMNEKRKDLLSKKQAAQKKKFGGELFPNLPEAGGHGYLNCFKQTSPPVVRKGSLP
jgi:hypothetical protein